MSNETVIFGANITSLSEYGIEVDFSDVTEFRGKPEFPSLTKVGDHGLYNVFAEGVYMKGTPTFPNLKTIGKYGMYHTFRDCKYIDGEISFTLLTTIGKHGMEGCFRNCRGTSDVIVDRSIFGIRSVEFPQLVTIEDFGMYQCFMGCWDLGAKLDNRNRQISTESIDISFPKLKTIRHFGLGEAFINCTSLRNVYFPALVYSASTTVAGSASRLELVDQNTEIQDNNGYKQATITTVYRFKDNGSNMPVPKEPNQKNPNPTCFFKAFRGCSNLTVHLPRTLSGKYPEWTLEYFGLKNDSRILFDLG